MPPPAMIPRDYLQMALRLVPRTLRFWKTGFVTAAVLGLVAVLVVVLLPKEYRSEAVVHYREGLQWRSDEAMSARRVGQRLRDMLLARSQLTKLVEELGLFPELVKAGRLAEAVEEMRLKADFRPVAGDVFIVSYTARTPEEAHRVASKLTDVLIGENARLQSEQAELQSQFLDVEKQRMEREVAEKEAAQLRFLAAHPEFAQEAMTGVGVTFRASPTRASGETTPPPPRTDGVLGALRREEQRLRRQLASPNEIPPAPPPPELVAAKTEAEAKLREAQRELADSRSRFTEQHPDVRTAAARVADAEGAVRRASEELAASRATVPVSVLKERLGKVVKDIAAYQRDHAESKGTSPAVARSDAAKRIVALETEWTRLSREVGEARERLQHLDAQQFTASMTATMLTSGQSGLIVKIDPAFVPARPIGLSPKKRLAAGILLALGLGVAAMVARALLDDLVHDASDLARVGIAPVLVEIGRRALPALDRGSHAAHAPRTGPLPAGAVAAAAELTASTESPAAAPSLEATPAAAPSLQAAPDPRAAAFGRPAAEPARPLPAAPDAPPFAANAPGVRRELATAGQATAVLAPAEETVGTQIVRSAFSVRSARSELVDVLWFPPPAALDERLFMIHAPDGAAAASFRILRHRLSARDDVRTILVCSPRAGEGKTLTAVNLALALGEARRSRVLLLDANFRAPSVARWMGLQPPFGLGEQLEIHRERPEAPWLVVQSVAPSVHVLAIAPDGERPLLDGQMLASCVSQLRAAGYEYIVIDGPPVLGSADVNLMDECIDGSVLVLRAGKSRALELRKASEQMGTSKLLGLVLLGT